MNGLNRIVFRNLKVNKKRTRATLIGIILSCILLFSVSLIVSTIKQNRIEEARRSYGEHHVVFEDVPYKKSFDIFKNDEKVQSFLVTQSVDSIFFSKLDYEESVDMVIRSADFDLSEYLKLLNGDYPKTDGELLIPQSLSQKGNITIGDTIGNYIVTGIYGESVLGKDYISKNRDYIYRPISYIKKPIDDYNKTSSFYIKYKSPMKAYSNILEEALSIGVEYELNSLKEFNNVFPNTVLLSAHGVQENPALQLKTYLFLAILLYVLSLFCILIIYNSFSISLTERKKEFGILRSIGASKNQILSLVAKEVVLLGLISIPIAFMFSYIFIKCGIIFVNHFLKLNVNLFIDIFYVTISLFFIIFMIVVSAITPARKASQVSPLEAVKNAKYYRIKMGKENYPFIRKIFGIEGELAYKNIKRNGKKFSSTVLSLSISILLFITVSTFINYFFINLDDNIDRQFDISIYLYDNDLVDSEKFIERLENSKYIDDMVISKKGLFMINDNGHAKNEYFSKSGKTINIVGMDNKSFRKYSDLLHIKDDKIILYNMYELYDENGNMISSGEAYDDNPVLDICEYANKQSCYLKLDNIHTTKENYLSMFNSPSIIVDNDTFEKYIDEYFKFHPGDFQSNKTYEEYLKTSIDIDINSKKYELFDKEMESLLNIFTNMKISYSNGALENHEVIVQLLIIKFIFYVVLLFIAIISITGMLNSINTNLSLRSIEFSVLRSIGLESIGLDKMIRLESMFLVLKTGLISVSVSLVTIIAIRYVSSIQTIPGVSQTLIPIPWKYIIISVVGVLFIILIATKFSISKIKGKNIIDSIKKESI